MPATGETHDMASINRSRWPCAGRHVQRRCCPVDASMHLPIRCLTRTRSTTPQRDLPGHREGQPDQAGGIDHDLLLPFAARFTRSGMYIHAAD
jgi:hypothetical protein